MIFRRAICHRRFRTAGLLLLSGVLRGLERFTGVTLVREIGEFIGAIEALTGALRSRVAETQALLHGDATSLVLVTAPEPRPTSETSALVEAASPAASPAAARGARLRASFFAATGGLSASYTAHPHQSESGGRCPSLRYSSASASRRSSASTASAYSGYIWRMQAGQSPWLNCASEWSRM